MSKACIFHDAGNVCKVEVNESGVLDKVGNAGDGLTQDIVGNFKRVCESDLLIGSVLKAVIGDYKQRVDLAEHLFNAVVCLIHATLTLELEGLGNDADGEYAGLASDICNGGSSACSRAAAHACGDKHHIGIFDCFCNVIAAFLGALLADFGIGACALTVGQLLADLDLLIRAGHGKCLLIGVDRYELNALSSGLDHSIYDVVTGAADTNDLYSYNIFRAYFGFEIHFVSSSTVI